MGDECWEVWVELDVDVGVLDEIDVFLMGEGFVVCCKDCVYVMLCFGESCCFMLLKIVFVFMFEDFGNCVFSVVFDFLVEI